MVSFAIRSPRSGRQKGSLPQVVSLSPAYAGCVAAHTMSPRARGLALGYMLSPATRVAAAHTMSPRARGLRPGLYAVARVRGLCRRSDNVTRARGLRPGLYAVACVRRLCRRSDNVTQGSRTRPGLYAVARVRGLCRRSRNVTQGSRTRPGRYAAARYAGCRRSLHCGCAPISFDRAKASSPTTTPSAPCL